MFFNLNDVTMTIEQLVEFLACELKKLESLSGRFHNNAYDLYTQKKGAAWDIHEYYININTIVSESFLYPASQEENALHVKAFNIINSIHHQINWIETDNVSLLNGWVPKSVETFNGLFKKEKLKPNEFSAKNTHLATYTLIKANDVEVGSVDWDYVEYEGLKNKFRGHSFSLKDTLKAQFVKKSNERNSYWKIFRKSTTGQLTLSAALSVRDLEKYTGTDLKYDYDLISTKRFGQFLISELKKNVHSGNIPFIQFKKEKNEEYLEIVEDPSFEFGDNDFAQTAVFTNDPAGNSGWSFRKTRLSQNGIDYIYDSVSIPLSSFSKLPRDQGYIKSAVFSKLFFAKWQELKTIDKAIEYCSKYYKSEEYNPFVADITKTISAAQWRVYQRQILKRVTAGLLQICRAKGHSNSEIKLAEKFLSSKLGEATLSLIIGFGGDKIPQVNSNPKFAKLMDEFKVEGMAVVGDEFIESIYSTLMVSAFEHKNVEKIRVGLKKEIDSELVEEEQLSTILTMKA